MNPDTLKMVGYLWYELDEIMPVITAIYLEKYSLEKYETITTNTL